MLTKLIDAFLDWLSVFGRKMAEDRKASCDNLIAEGIPADEAARISSHDPWDALTDL